jgi:Tfp pilus assembly protein PilV
MLRTGRNRGRHSQGQILAAAMIALVVMAFTGLTLVSLADMAYRSVARAKQRAVAGARADAGLVAAKIQLEEALVESAGGLAVDGTTGSGEVSAFVETGDARWEWEIRVVQDGGYWRLSKFIRGYGKDRGKTEVAFERQLRSYSLLNYSWFSRTGTLSFGQAFQTDGSVYAGSSLAFNNYQNQYFGGRAECVGDFSGRGDDGSQNRTFAMEGMPRQNVPAVLLDTDVEWFQHTQASAQDGGITLPPGYDYAIDFTGVDFTQPGYFTVKRRTRASWENTLSEVRDSTEGTWSNASIEIPMDFNGVIFAGAVDGDGGVTQRSSVKVKGTVQKQSVSVVATDDAFVWGNTYGGTTNGDFVRNGRSPGTDTTGTGDPVNVALVARNHIRVARDAPRILEFETALCAIDGTISPESTTANPAVDPYVGGDLTGWDLDMDGAIQTNNSDGWNELTLAPTHSGQTISESLWHLRTMGPLICKTSPSMGRWASYPGSFSSPPRNRMYGYDHDIVDHEPPAFPAALNVNTTSAWTERQGALGRIEGLEFLMPRDQQ